MNTRLLTMDNITMSPPTVRKRRPGGFALLVTLLLMVLLALIAVGLLGLTSIALRSAQAGQHQNEAQANARLALMLAISELQKELGPDQRISARAAVLDDDSGTGTPEGVANPHWLGVWDSWTDWLNKPGIKSTYDKSRSRNFRRWLVSTADLEPTGNLALARNPTPADAVEMAGAIPPEGHPVMAPLVGTTGNGRFAWWIAGENQKANIALTSPEETSDAGRLHRRSHWPGGRADWLTGLESAPGDAALHSRFVTLPTYGLGSADADFPKELEKRFHDLTVDSAGLAVNVRHGGLKRDLNLLLELDSLPHQYGNYSPQNPGGTIVPIRPHHGHLPKTFYPQGLNFPSWYKLHQYYQLYRGGGHETAADCTPVPFPGAGLWGSAGQPNINFNWHRQNLDYYGIGRTPIVARLMLVFSTRRVAAAQPPGTYDYKLGVNPVVVLWNPYNVTLHSPPLWIQITPGALEYKTFVDGQMHVDWTQLRRQSGPFQLNIYPMEGPSQATRSIVLKPGETRIYSAVSGFVNSADFRHAELYPGYQSPDAGGGFEVDLQGMTGLSARSRVELAMRMSDRRTDHGGQYQIYWTVRNAQTGESQRYNEMAANPVEDGRPIFLADESRGRRVLFSGSPQRVPFANFQFVMKSGQDLRVPGDGYAQQDFRCRNFIHANPVNQRAMYGEATARMRGMAQYHVQIETGSGNSLNPDFDPTTNRAYIGSAVSPGGSIWPGQTNAVISEFPLVPVTSLASLMHFKLNPGDTRDFASGRHLWEVSANQALAIGNSFAHPLIAGGAIYQNVADASCRGNALQMLLIRDFHDHGFLHNDALWDDWFCSGITREDQGLYKTGRGLGEVVRQFADGTAPGRNPHLVSWFDRHEAPAALTGHLLSAGKPKVESHRIVARHAMIRGSFNINSSSVEAWKAFFAGASDGHLVFVDPSSGNIRRSSVPDDRVLVSRFSLPASDKEGRDAGDPASWLGVRLLTPEQIDRLARECVRQVKERGPFLNLSDFINRRLANDETGVCGALQAAIDWDEFLGRTPVAGNAESINGRFKGGDDFITPAKVAGWELPFQAAATGSRFAGIPGYLTQADLLKRIGNSITPRDDTFRIRAYGDVRDAQGNIRARAWCEAVVQRVPIYLDQSDTAEIPTADLTSDINRKFGRRLDVISFRWLSPDEI